MEWIEDGRVVGIFVWGFAGNERDGSLWGGSLCDDGNGDSGSIGTSSWFISVNEFMSVNKLLLLLFVVLLELEDMATTSSFGFCKETL